MQYSSNTFDIGTNIPGNSNQSGNNDYIPGKCNLGTEEIEMRSRKAKIGLMLTLLSIIAIQIFHPSLNYRLLIFIPLFYSILCYYQAQQKFCVAFGIIGIYNFETLGKSKRVTQNEFKNQDIKNSWLIILKTFLLSFIIVAIYYFLPI